MPGSRIQFKSMFIPPAGAIVSGKVIRQVTPADWKQIVGWLSAGQQMDGVRVIMARVY